MATKDGPLEDEEEGLRAFALTVGARAEGSYPLRPEWIEVDGVRRTVDTIDATWREEDRLGFRVRLEGGPSMLVYYVPELDLWSGAPAGEAGGPRVVPRRNRS